MNFLPKDDMFFNLFINSANNIYEAAELFKQMMGDTSDIKSKAEKLKTLEEKGDKNTHEIYTQLNKSFVTPLDREDIHQIAKELDNILDYIEDTAYWFSVFNVKEIKSEAIELSDLILKAVKEIQSIMNNMKNFKNTKELYKNIIEINRLENEGDLIFRSAVAKLFQEEMSPLEVIKWKDAFQMLENTLDICEDVANTIEGVIMKHV